MRLRSNLYLQMKVTVILLAEGNACARIQMAADLSLDPVVSPRRLFCTA